MHFDRSIVMRFKIENDKNIQLQLSEEELIILNNALNEICNGIEVPEFETRIGANLEKVKTLLMSTGNVLDSLPK